MEKIEKEIFKHFKNLSDEIMSKEATDKDIVDDLMRTLNTCQSRLKEVEEQSDKAIKVLEVAVEGLYAISKYGNSQNIARKTLEQINSIRKK